MPSDTSRSRWRASGRGAEGARPRPKKLLMEGAAPGEGSSRAGAVSLINSMLAMFRGPSRIGSRRQRSDGARVGDAVLGAGAEAVRAAGVVARVEGVRVE